MVSRRHTLGILGALAAGAATAPESLHHTGAAVRVAAMWPTGARLAAQSRQRLLQYR